MASPINVSEKYRQQFREQQEILFPSELEAYFAEEITQRLSFIKRGFETILYQGPPLKKLIPLLHQRGQLTLFLNGGLDRDLAAGEGQFSYAPVLPCRPFSYDLIVSVMHMHASEDLPSLLLQYQFALKEGGLLLCVFPGQETLREVKDACYQLDTDLYGGVYPRIIPFIAADSYVNCVKQAEFVDFIVDIDRKIVRYQHLKTLWADIKTMKEQNFLKTKKPLFPGYAKQLEAYLKQHKQDFSITLDFIWSQSWKK